MPPWRPNIGCGFTADALGATAARAEAEVMALELAAGVAPPLLSLHPSATIEATGSTSIRARFIVFPPKSRRR
jgi:hypothetical protein